MIKKLKSSWQFLNGMLELLASLMLAPLIAFAFMFDVLVLNREEQAPVASFLRKLSLPLGWLAVLIFCAAHFRGLYIRYFSG